VGQAEQMHVLGRPKKILGHIVSVSQLVTSGNVLIRSASNLI